MDQGSQWQDKDWGHVDDMYALEQLSSYGPYIWCFSVVCCFIIGWHIYVIHILKGFLDELVFFKFFIEPAKDSQLVGNLSLNHGHYYVGHKHDIKHNLQNKINLCTLPKFPF